MQLTNATLKGDTRVASEVTCDGEFNTFTWEGKGKGRGSQVDLKITPLVLRACGGVVAYR